MKRKAMEILISSAAENQNPMKTQVFCQFEPLQDIGTGKILLERRYSDESYS
jgi:hypothetical protein